jgi:hypothetical protein
LRTRPIPAAHDLIRQNLVPASAFVNDLSKLANSANNDEDQQLEEEDEFEDAPQYNVTGEEIDEEEEQEQEQVSTSERGKGPTGGNKRSANAAWAR